VYDLIHNVNYLRGGMHAYLHTVEAYLLEQGKFLLVMLILTS
jgi:hypothetical protein